MVNQEKPSRAILGFKENQKHLTKELAGNFMRSAGREMEILTILKDHCFGEGTQ